VAQEVNQYKKQIQPAVLLTSPQASVSLSNKSAVKTKIGKELPKYSKKDCSKSSTKKLLKLRQNEENLRLVRWTEARKSELTITLRTELLIIEQD
jgi:hypothetical protein